MRNPRRIVNICLVVVAVIAIGAAVIAATSGGKTAGTGNATACDAFWGWYDGTAGSAPLVNAYKEATTQPLIADLYNVHVGLTDQGKGLNGNKAANLTYAQSAGNNVYNDCTSAGYPDPES
jgi:hypothetical protein